MFIGEYYHNLDAKGRIIIPAKFRDELNGTFILTRGLDGCLTIYSTEKGEKIFEEINKLPETKKATRQYIRMLTANACECTLDNQGRILIPANLSGSVNITKPHIKERPADTAAVHLCILRFPSKNPSTVLFIL